MPETTSRLRCVTLNVLGPANPDWERRSLIIKEVLDRLGADVVARRRSAPRTRNICSGLATR